MTYEEFLRNSLEEKSGGFFDLGDSDASWRESWEEHNIYPNGDGGWTDDFGHPLDFPDDMPVYDYCIERESESARAIVMFFNDGNSRQYMIDWVRVLFFDFESVAVDVTNEEVGTIDAVDALLGTGLNAASKKAEELKKRKLVTVANLQKALEDYDERKGTAVEDGEPTDGKNKVFIDGSGRVYAKRTELAQKLSLDVEKSERQSADNRLSAEIAKKAEKEHTHKAADITDLPNYARSVNGEEPDADGNVEIDIDAVVEVAELPGETKKKVYLVPEKEEQSVSVDCSSVESMMAAVATWLTGETQSPTTVEEFLECLKATTADKGTVNVDSYDNVTVDLSSPGFVDGMKFLQVSVGVDPYTLKLFDKSGNLIGTGFTDSNVSFKRDSTSVFKFRKFTTQDYDSGWVDGFYKSGNAAYMKELTLPTSMYFGENRRTPPAVYAKSVELATKEALSEATSGADEKAAALGERIGAVESSVTTAQSDITKAQGDIATAQSDITAMKSDITTAKTNITAMKSNITEAQANITKAQGDIEAVAAEVETVKTDVAALEGKVVRSVNGTEPDENGNVEVAASSDASGKNDTITVSDTDSAISDDTGILSGESGENPKGLLRFAASKIWNYIKGKLNTELGIKGSSGRTEILKRFEYSGKAVFFPFVIEGELNFFGDENCHAIVEESFDTSFPDNHYILDFGLASPYPSRVVSVKVLEKKTTGFKVDIETSAEGDDTYLSYIAVAFL